MRLNAYQIAARQYAKYKTADYPFLALAEEVGEVMSVLAKHCRKNDATLGEAVVHPEVVAKLTKELGDVLWQLSACAYEIGLDLDELACDNLEKLSDRNDRGVIVGEGDDR